MPPGLCRLADVACPLHLNPDALTKCLGPIPIPWHYPWSCANTRAITCLGCLSTIASIPRHAPTNVVVIASTPSSMRCELAVIIILDFLTGSPSTAFCHW